MLLREERVQEIYEELDALVRDYYEHTLTANDGPPIDFNWPIYCALQDAEGLVLYTARDRSKLVGFVMYHVMPHLHHRSKVNAMCDTLAVDRMCRGKGIGRALMMYAEPRLKELGVNYVTHQFRTCYTAKPLFPSLGYKLIEYGYLKELD